MRCAALRAAHAARRRRRPASPEGELGVLAWVPWVTALLALVVAWWLKARCVADGDWEGGEQLTDHCYTDVVALWFTHGVADGAVPYLDDRLEYPPLIGAQVYVTAAMTRAFGGGAFAFYNINALFNAAFLVGTLAVLRRLHVPATRQLWWTLAPTVVLYAFVNWDALPVFLLVLAVALHLSGRDAAAGVAVGLGTAAKLFPALIVPLVVIARLRQRKGSAAARHLIGAGAAWAMANLPVALVSFEGWSWFFEFNRERGANFATLWAVAAEVDLLALEPGVLNVVSAVAFAAGALLIVVVGLGRLPPGGTWGLVLPLLAWFLVTNKVFSPQYDLWLLPLLVLVLPRAAPLAAFLAADLAVFLTEFAYLAERAGVGPSVGYAPLGAAVVFRSTVLLWIVVGSLRRSTPLLSAGHRQEPNQIRSSSSAFGISVPYQMGRK